MSNIKNFRDQLLKAIEQMDCIVSASPIEQNELVIGAELDNGGELVFIEIQPA